MPSPKGLKMFVRKEPLSDDEWLCSIEKRRGLIKPHLDSFTLSDLGSLKCMRNDSGFEHELRFDNPELTGDIQFTLKTQGIFCKQPWEAVEHVPETGHRTDSGMAYPNGNMQVWGLTRSGVWVIVAIYFVGEPGRKNRGYERAITAEITVTDIRSIVEKTKEKPQKIWEALGKEIKGWAGHRKYLYDNALELARSVELEELALAEIPVF